MEYIKNYNEELYNYIITLKEEEDKKYLEEKKKFRLFRFFIKAYKRLTVVFMPKTLQNMIIDSALQYMNISREKFDSNVQEILEDIKNHGRYESQKDTDIFWKNQINELWTCLNIFVQMNWYGDFYSEIYKIIKKRKNLEVCDYGCGSAVFSLVLNELFHFKHLDLFDLDNYTAGFVKHHIKTKKLDNVQWNDILEEKEDKKYDMIVCLDVLEHLENSFEIFLKLDRQLKPGGLFLLKIAFESEDNTHLPQAAEDFFFKNEGYKYLKDNYKLVRNFRYHGQLINGIYKKIGGENA